MKHKIKFTDFEYDDVWGTTVEIDGEALFYDGERTYNCIEEILTKLGVDYEIEYCDNVETKRLVTRKKKLVEDD